VNSREMLVQTVDYESYITDCIFIIYIIIMNNMLIQFLTIVVFLQRGKRTVLVIECVKA